MHKALIVVDMQNDFIDGALGTPEAQSIVDNVIDEIKSKQSNGYTIFATQDTHYDNYLDTLEGNKLPIKHCIKNTNGWKLQEDIRELISEDNIIEKLTFGSEDLVERLKEFNPEEIEILGLCTDICVVSNAIMLRAAFPNIPIYIKENCCAGVTPGLHKSALDTMKSCQMEII